jgi:hypothetical protein
MHSASFLSQSFSEPVHLSTSALHTLPDQPDTHVHENEFTPSEHVAPFMHGDEAHSLSFPAQLDPL